MAQVSRSACFRTLAAQPECCRLSRGTAAVFLPSGLFALLDSSHSRNVAIADGAISLLTFGAAASYGVLIPPVQAPDETSHFLTFGALTGQQHFERETEAGTRLGHVGRIQFDAAQRFRPSDVGTPYPLRWKVAYPQDLERRSGSPRRYGDWWPSCETAVRAIAAPAALHAAICAAAGPSRRVIVGRRQGKRFPVPIGLSWPRASHSFPCTCPPRILRPLRVVRVRGRRDRHQWSTGPPGRTPPGILATALVWPASRLRRAAHGLWLRSVARLILAARERPTIAVRCSSVRRRVASGARVDARRRPTVSSHAGVVDRAPRRGTPIVACSPAGRPGARGAMGCWRTRRDAASAP